MAIINTKSEYDKIREESDRLVALFRKKEEQNKQKELANNLNTNEDEKKKNYKKQLKDLYMVLLL
jgi:hypothetical protein